MRGMDQTPPPPLRFRKMHGLGNDFVVIDARAGDARVTPALARALGDRHRGVGFDQLAELLPVPEGDAAALRIRFWNADGSTAGACGNATRCVASLAMAETGADALILRTEFGLLPAARRADGLIEVNMGVPALDWTRIPLAEPADTAALPLPGAPGAVSMGNPHCVFFVPDAEDAPLLTDGPHYEHHPMFPERTNVEFAEILAPGDGVDRIRLRVWERGAGVTLACGSGACATVVAAARRGLTGRRAEVVLDGGSLFIDWREDGVRMAGPVAEVFEAALSPAFLALVETGSESAREAAE
ncbi:diaminopimelate epimerase [Albimonas donghaensis]|uniref:Diaminopimelate epimerase n=2 Tax=Albimonas donghaensis TaxID=356660 RepID=A0A1H3EZG3_9RHOB|nr:diaminopimelate epimerase [Albimonas donghaensis]